MKIKFTQSTVAIENSSKNYAMILNEMAEYLESHDPPPNHWEEQKRFQAYQDIYDSLGVFAVEMIERLSQFSAYKK